MSFVDASRTLPQLVISDLSDEDARRLAKRIQDFFVILERWINDLAAAHNSNAGGPEVVDGFTDLPPVAEAVGRIYYLMVTATPGPAPPAGKRFVASDGVNWLALD